MFAASPGATHRSHLAAHRSQGGRGLQSPTAVIRRLERLTGEMAMAYDDKAKLKTEIAIAGGVAAGTSSIIDTSAYKSARLMTWGTTGSCTSNLYSSIGTTVGTAATTMPAFILLGSHRSDGTGVFKSTAVSGLTGQAIITHSSITGTYHTSYYLFD